ncbi:MAG TPA: adenylate/guanylate cyclase domain-containing protein [Nevskiaceae bacterium]|nr:adenylate/guanylate cyclase domain-containing protein [Nevskiaceae bacterium]
MALSLLLFLVFLVHTSGLHTYRLLTQIEAITYDARVLLTLPGTPDPAVVVLDVDEKSIAAEGWPWPRNKWAALVQTLFEKYPPRVLAFDIGFAEPDRSSGAELLDRLAQQDLADLPGFADRVAPIRSQLDFDGQFAEAIRGKPIVLGYFYKSQVPEDEPAETGALCPPLMDADAARLYGVDFLAAEGFGGNVATLQSATPHCGFFDNPTVDEDGVYRRVPLMQSYKGAVYPSLALAAVQLALGNEAVELEFDPPDRRTSLNLERVRIGDVVVPVDGDVAAYVPYRGPYKTFTYVSATDALHGRIDPAVLKDAIVIVGTSAAGLLDLRTTPVGRAYAGVEVHANLVSGMLGDRVHQKAPYYSGIETVLLAIIAVLLALVFPRLSPLAGAGLGVGTLAVIVALAMAMWSGAHFIMPMGVPLVFTLALFMAHLLYGYFIESRRTRDISRRFGQYVPPELVVEMAERPESLSMEGESREMTVLFSDVRDFTSISEKLDARELAALMNIYLTRMTGEIQRQRGTIDKYIGDAIMAFWGAPLPEAAHATRALEAGLALVRAVRGLDAEFAKRGWPALHIGVGVNSGKMSVGNMGSEFRVAYTVMGDAVNLGSRVEGLTKEYGVPILCTEFTRAGAPSDWSFREVDLVRVKGRKEPVAIYEPLGPKDALDPALRQDLARHRGAMKLYRQQAWDQAEVEFYNLTRSGRPHAIYELFLKRIAYLRQNPPGAGWDGSFTFTTK